MWTTADAFRTESALARNNDRLAWVSTRETSRAGRMQGKTTSRLVSTILVVGMAHCEIRGESRYEVQMYESRTENNLKNSKVYCWYVTTS